LKLNQQVFLQMAFNTLKERCLFYPPEVKDVAALHRFLERYLIALAQYQSGAMRGGAAARGRGAASVRERPGGRNGDDSKASPQEHRPTVPPLMTSDELRVQLRAEYAVDVYSDAVRLASQPEARANPEGTLLPHEMTEEEFYRQLGKPSGMAQECCVM
jgi:hypothetical protein